MTDDFNKWKIGSISIKYRVMFAENIIISRCLAFRKIIKSRNAISAWFFPVNNSVSCHLVKACHSKSVWPLFEYLFNFLIFFDNFSLLDNWMMDLDSRVFTIYSIPFLSSSFSSSGTQPILTPILKWTLKEWKLLVQVRLSKLVKVNGQNDHWKWTIPDRDVFVCTRCWAYLQTSVIINKNDCGRLKCTLTNSGKLIMHSSELRD